MPITPVNPFLPAPPPTPAQVQAAKLQALVAQIGRDGATLLQQAIATIERNWSAVWMNPNFTAAEIVAVMGPAAAEIFRSAGIFTAAIEQIGLGAPTPAELLDSKYLSAAVPYTANADGTIVLNPTPASKE